MRVFSNAHQAIMRLGGDEIDKVLNVDWDSVNSITTWKLVQRARQMETILSATDFKPDVKTWLETSLGPYGDQYHLNWKAVASNANWDIKVTCDLHFENTKYAALFRLTWL